MGLLAKSTIGLGTVSVSGLSRVPYPPTRMSAFMLLCRAALSTIRRECLICVSMLVSSGDG